MSAVEPKPPTGEAPMRVPWPPILFAALGALAYGLDAIMPMAPGLPQGAMRVAGLVLIAVAVVIDLWSAATLWRARTAILPNRRATSLVTGGPFSVSRNPIYVGYVMLLVGAGLVLDAAWFLPAAALCAVLIDRIAIRREETHLEARFGASYETYCTRVRRWL